MAEVCRFVVYLAEQTGKRIDPRLDSDAQREAVVHWLSSGGLHRAIAEYVERLPTGRGARRKHATRPELAKALAKCASTGAVLLFAAISGLTRDAAFLSALSDAEVEFVAVGMPSANRTTVGLMARLAEDESRLASQRAKTGLAAAKAQGKALGGFRGGPKVDGALGTAAIKARADAFAASIAPILSAMRDEGLSLNAMAARLMEKGVQTARGGTTWTATAVKNVLARTTG